MNVAFLSPTSQGQFIGRSGAPPPEWAGSAIDCPDIPAKIRPLPSRWLESWILRFENYCPSIVSTSNYQIRNSGNPTCGGPSSPGQSHRLCHKFGAGFAPAPPVCRPILGRPGPVFSTSERTGYLIIPSVGSPSRTLWLRMLSASPAGCPNA